MNIAKFDQIILSEEYALVYFYATWCSPCKAMSPVLKKLQTEAGTKLRIISIDIEKSGAISDRYKIRATPTCILLNKGKTLWRKTGALPLPMIKSEIFKFL